MAFRGDNRFKNLGIPLNYVPRPRAPPRLIRPPSPFTMERPQPIVPDVSLIIDSAATSFHSNPERTFEEDNRNQNQSGQASFPNKYPPPRNGVIPRNESASENTPSMNFVNYYPTPSPNTRSNNGTQMSHSLSNSKDSGNCGSPDDTSTSENLPLDENNVNNMSRKSDRSVSPPAGGYESLREDIASVKKIVSSQADSIHQISSQLQKIIAFQDKLLVHIARGNKSSSLSKCVQTETVVIKQVESPEERRRISEENLQRRGSNERSSSSSLGKRPAIASETMPSQNSSTKRASPSMRQELLKNKVLIPSSAPPEDKRTGGEDLSLILKNLQISNVQQPSTYSDTSMKSIECPPFADETFQHETSSIGPSVSANGSDAEDDSLENILPSVTYYNNLLSTVNRVLDGGQKAEPNKAILEDNRGEGRPSSSISRRNSGRNSKGNSPVSSAVNAFSQGTASYSSGSASSSVESIGGRDDFKENYPRGGTSDAKSLVNRFLDQQRGASPNPDQDDCVVESTKKYLQSLGVKFDNPSNSNPQPTPPLSSQKQNYMIQQNVYNSIYIPTVNCVQPVISESLDSNSGMIDNLARKYIPSGDRNHYEMLTGRANDPGPNAETTVYGMTPGNLSFATKEYLKRHGLVGQTEEPSVPQPRAIASAPAEKVLDITAIRNQPKLL